MSLTEMSMAPEPANPLDPADLSLEEKAALLSGGGMWSTAELPRAGVPALVLTDGPHGIRLQDPAVARPGIDTGLPATCFPPAVAVGSSWNPEVAARIGAAVGREARALGVDVVLGPGVNIKRAPLCGRNFEYYAEDPLLSGVLASAHVQALQAQGVGASVKHFAANNQETERMRISADVDERTLREIYLPAFERVVTEAAPATVMSAYNAVNGVPASQNRWLLTQVLREEWGFDGAVVSDWGGVYDHLAALGAGLDLRMPGPNEADAAAIVQAVRAGGLDEAVVDRAVRRVLALVASAVERRDGAVTGPATTGLDAADPMAVEHHALAREVAAECAVLLRNEGGVLPLAPGARLAVVGALAQTPVFQGGGSSRITPTRVDTPLEALREAVGEVAYARGYVLDGGVAAGVAGAAKAEAVATEADTVAGETGSGAGDKGSAAGDSGTRVHAAALRAEAVELAAGADVAVVFVGPPRETEGVDRERIDLPADQVEVIRAVAAAAPRTVVVLSNGGVVSLEGWHDDVDAILECWVLGQAAGGAIADLLLGVVNPSGHLAETIPLRLEHTPAYLNFPGEAGHVRYGEGVMVGYRHYTAVDRPVRYPFGHGLTYTTFTTDALDVTPTGDDTADAHVTVTNTGPRAGHHVIQLYVSAPASPVRRPHRDLRAFTKLFLHPGETRTITLPLTRRAFAYYDIQSHTWTITPGTHTLEIGDNATTILATAPLTLPGDTPTTPPTLDSPISAWLTHPVIGPNFREILTTTLGDSSPDNITVIASMPLRHALNYPGAERLSMMIAPLLDPPVEAEPEPVNPDTV